MLKSTNDIHDFYETNDEDIRLRRPRVNNIEFITTLKYLEKVCPPQSKILDACAGTGIYAFYLAQKGYKVTAGDLVECNVAQMKKQQESNQLLENIYVGSIMDLSMFADESFDVVLNLGAFYHLTDESDRIRAVEESLRVLRPNGVYCLAYLNRYANNSLFYASTPENIESFMSKFALQQLHNIATDGLKFVMRDTVNSFSDSEFERWLNIHYQMCEVKSLLGYSEHALYIGRKVSTFENLTDID